MQEKIELKKVVLYFTPTLFERMCNLALQENTSVGNYLRELINTAYWENDDFNCRDFTFCVFDREDYVCED